MKSVFHVSVLSTHQHMSILTRVLKLNLNLTRISLLPQFPAIISRTLKLKVWLLHRLQIHNSTIFRETQITLPFSSALCVFKQHTFLLKVNSPSSGNNFYFWFTWLRSCGQWRKLDKLLLFVLIKSRLHMHFMQGSYCIQKKHTCHSKLHSLLWNKHSYVLQQAVLC